MPLNPFLRAFFKSSLPQQCVPSSQYILLVPTSDSLLNFHDAESDTPYAELAYTEDFLGHHVLRFSTKSPNDGDPDGPRLRDARARNKLVETFSGSHVLVKDSTIFTHRGFKHTLQINLLDEWIYQIPGLNAEQWLIYHVSRPLVGVPTPVLPPIIHSPTASGQPQRREGRLQGIEGPAKTTSRPPTSFNDLLNDLPLLAREIQPSIETILQNVETATAKWDPNPLPHSLTSQVRRSSSSSRTSISSGHSGSSRETRQSNGSIYRGGYTLLLNPEEQIMKSAAEKAVNACSSVLNRVSQSQVNMIFTNTSLTPLDLERLLEKAVMEHLHNRKFFSRLCQVWRQHDHQLESKIRGISSVDIAQLGPDLANTTAEKNELAERIEVAGEKFVKMATATSPLEMMEILQSTLRALSAQGSSQEEGELSEKRVDEKIDAMLTVDADLLVSLLLMVIARSEVRHHYARLSYMQHFIFVDDAQSGEMGYALSTLEAVVAYIDQESASLAHMSKLNKKLWYAVQNGDVSIVERMLLPTTMPTSPRSPIDGTFSPGGRRGRKRVKAKRKSSGNSNRTSRSVSPNLRHVYPFEAPDAEADLIKVLPGLPKPKKVTLSTRSMSISSFSVVSQSNSGIGESPDGEDDADLTLAYLAYSQDFRGTSILMRAVESRQKEVLSKLLSMKGFFPARYILDDKNASNTTLLSAAVQARDAELLEILLSHESFADLDSPSVLAYLELEDKSGRTVGQFLFNLPLAMSSFGPLINWHHQDQNGQTPLFATCRCYDHPEYHAIVRTSLSHAQAAYSQQKGLQKLPLSLHVDKRGNTLLHILRDPDLITHILSHCICDVNLVNDRYFTPLMVLSKYEKFPAIIALLADPRVDVYPRESRGLTAVELAKNEPVRDALDDQLFMFLYPSPASALGIIRTMLVEDATVRVVLKSRSAHGDGFRITTTKRGLEDFLTLSRRLLSESPASFLPDITASLLSPFHLPSKPSRAVLRDIQFRLDAFFKALLSHPTFSRNPLIWEFILAPELDQKSLDARSSMLSHARAERIREEYAPLEDVRDTEAFLSVTREAISGVDRATRGVRAALLRVRAAEMDVCESLHLLARQLAGFAFLPKRHLASMGRYASISSPSAVPPAMKYNYTLSSQISVTSGILTALGRPQALIRRLASSKRSMGRHTLSLKRSHSKWPLGLLDDTREKVHRDAEERFEKAKEEVEGLGREIRWHREIVAGEVSGWQEEREEEVSKGVRDFVKDRVIREREVLMRLEALLEKLKGSGFR